MVTKHHVICAVCEKKDYITVGDGAEHKQGWHYFGKLNVNSCATTKHLLKLKEGKSLLDDDCWDKVSNWCYDKRIKPKYVEYWECSECYDREMQETS